VLISVSPSPLTQYPGGTVDVAVKAIAKARGVSDEEVLLAWSKAKGSVPVT
jgi:diketogulonate reductase-like aldo/keto reductase